MTESQYNLAAMQVGMSEWGIPQPFITGTLNTYYYSKNAPAVFRAMIDRTAYPTTGDQILSDQIAHSDDVVAVVLCALDIGWHILILALRIVGFACVGVDDDDVLRRGAHLLRQLRLQIGEYIDLKGSLIFQIDPCGVF